MYLNEQLDHWASNTPDSQAIVFEGKAISFAQLAGKVACARGFLSEHCGIRAGDRVAYLGLNHPDMLVILFACESLGAIFNPLNSRLAREEYAFLLANAEPKLCFAEPSFADILHDIGNGDVEILSTGNLYDKPAGRDRSATSVPSSQPLLLVYTSGTTGRPKGVLLSRFAVQVNIENCQDLFQFRQGQRIQMTLPLFHVGGLCILLLPALMHGSTIHLHARFDPEDTLAEIEAAAITTSLLVPAQMAAMMEHPAWQTTDLSKMEYVVVGSSLIPIQQIKSFHDRGIPASQIYGATETGPAAIGLKIDEAMAHEGSAGQAMKHCRIDVRDKDRQSCPVGERGDVWVWGDNIFSGYWRDQKETDKVLVDGWYNTGDVGYVDDEGYYWIVDRSKDVIISGGENIYPAEIEAASLNHPAIAAIAVVGKADSRWGETPVAAVELVDNSDLDLEQYHSFLADRLARFKHPKELLIMASLPRNGMGKVEKSEIKKRIQQQG